MLASFFLPLLIAAILSPKQLIGLLYLFILAVLIVFNVIGMRSSTPGSWGGGAYVGLNWAVIVLFAIIGYILFLSS